MLHRHRRGAGLVLMIALILAGCSGSAPPPPANLVPVQGKVTYQGKVVPSAEVQFLPITDKLNEAFPAGAWTDAQGNFTLRTHPHGEGAQPGTYKVTVRLYPGVKGIPEQYGDAQTTPLQKVEIPAAGKKDLVLPLSD